jgi:hypothetical protein
MFGLMLKSTHEKAMSQRLRVTLEAIADLKTRCEIDVSVAKRAIDAEQAISASLRADIEEMTPDYERGKRRRVQYENDNAKRKERRAAKRAGV